jgi:hypothetical protein
MSYDVYKLRYADASGSLRSHHALFIETDEDQKGFLFHVVGDLQEGMCQEIMMHRNPADLLGYLSREFLGTIESNKYAEVDSLIRGTPAPWKQFDHRGRKLRPDRPIHRPEHWLEEVLETLRNWGTLRT